MNHVFLSYVREDREKAIALSRDLSAAGLDVWVDYDRIKPSQRWKNAIRKAIREGAAFIACFSEAYLRRTRSYFNEELTLAIEELRLRPQDQVWFIPALFSPESVPDRSIGAGETLKDLHWVALYEKWDEGVKQIVEAAKEAGIQPSRTRDEPEIPKDIEQLFQHDDPEIKEQLVMLRKLPITTYWVRAVQVEKVSVLFTAKIIELLTRSDDGHPLENAMTTLSFSLFCRAIEQIESLDCEFIRLLGEVIDEKEIPPNCKMFALQAVLRCGSRRCQGGIGFLNLPTIFAAELARERHQSLVAFLLYTLFESPDSSIPIGIFSKLWVLGSSPDRQAISRRVIAASEVSSSQLTQTVKSQLESIYDIDDEDQIVNTFRIISDAIRSSGERKANLAILNISEAKQLIEAAIFASKLGDFKYIEEWVQLSTTDLENLEKTHGKSVERYGLEGLAMDDRLTVGVLQRKKVPHCPMSVVDILLAGESGGEKADFLFINIFLSLRNLFQEEERRTVAKTINQTYSESVVLRTIASYYMGEISEENAVALLEKQKV